MARRAAKVMAATTTAAVRKKMAVGEIRAVAESCDHAEGYHRQRPASVARPV
jgi:hypothetical protein